MRRATRVAHDDALADLISIHALHEESDRAVSVLFEHGEISIHALHEESDSVEFAAPTSAVYFNPRSP